MGTSLASLVLLGWACTADAFAVGPGLSAGTGTVSLGLRAENARAPLPTAGQRRRVTDTSTLLHTAAKLLDGRVHHSGSEGEGWFDDKLLAMPVVLPPDEAAGRSKWMMWYYGRSGDEWAKGNKAFLPTGVSGLAESADGLTWKRVKGPLPEGAIMVPSDREDAFDAVQLGVVDVHPTDEGYVMHYLGGSSTPVSLGTVPGMPPLVGFRMSCGAATSTDKRGLVWEKRGEPLVEPGPVPEWDSNFASWPRVLPVDPSKPSGEWLLHYHALQPSEGEGAPPRWAAGVAVSDEEFCLGGVTKVGRVLEGGALGSWDERGIGTRHVIHHEGAMWMVFEGVNNATVHSLGLAKSEDGGRTWAKQQVPGKEEPGGPIFEPRRGEDAWDCRVVGTPYLVKMPAGGFRLYYVGSGFAEDGETTLMGIGCAESESLTGPWRRVEAIGA